METIIQQIAQELGKDPTPEQIAVEMNISADKVREIMKIAQEPVSLETPIGKVVFGQNQYVKLQQMGRNGKLGMIKPTLTNPDIIIEDASKAKEGGTAERGTSYVFVKAFKGKDGKRMYYFTSVTIKKDGSEVVISNQEKSINKISRLLQNGNVVWTNSLFSLHPTTQVEKSVSLNDSNRPTSTDNQPAWLGINSPEHSENKDNSNNVQSQENQGDFVFV